MREVFRIAAVVAASAVGAGSLFAQMPDCPVRPTAGTIVQNPIEAKSVNGVLSVDLTLRNAVDQYGFMHYCYNYDPGVTGAPRTEAPTLRLYPGDQLILTLTNRTTATGVGRRDTMPGMEMPSSGADPCQGGGMSITSTNIHFHGLNIPPVCHQDDVVKTLIKSGEAPFEYKIRIPPNEPPGLYWYHPHPHGYTTTQVEGGASGALIVEGIDQVRPIVAGLKERILILRQQFYNANSWVPGPFQFTLNFQTSSPGLFPLPIIAMEPNKSEFWRFLNSSTQAFVSLQVLFGGAPVNVKLISVDGVPIAEPKETAIMLVPPAGRVEFIVPGPQAGEYGTLMTQGVNTGQLGNSNPANPIAQIMTLPTQTSTSSVAANSHPLATVPDRFAGLADAKPTAQRKLYFSERVVNLVNQYFITVQGQTPKAYSPSEAPAIITRIGAVEDWTVENHALEIHAFHIHQMHFLVTKQNGQPVASPTLQDTISVPAWTGKGPFPSVTLRMDFRDPEIAGTFVYHCHILDHEDGGMMGKILVQPASN